MKVCTSCRHEQTAGNFCGKCGAALLADEQETVQRAEEAPASEKHIPAGEREAAASTAAETNEQIEMLKSESKQFFHFLLSQFKEPSRHLSEYEGSMKNGLLSIITYIVLIAAIFFLQFRTLAQYTYGFSEFAFTRVIMPVCLVALLAAAITIFAVYATAAFFSRNLTLKEAAHQIGGFFIVPIAVAAMSLLALLIKSYTVSFVLLGMSSALAFGIIPVFTVITLLAKHSKSADRFYAFIFYLLTVSILGSLASLLIIDSQIGELIDTFNPYSGFWDFDDFY